MSNVRCLQIDPQLAAKAKAAEYQAKRQFHEKILGLHETFSLKESARLLVISTGWLRNYSQINGITFADATKRTNEQQRLTARKIEKLRLTRQRPTDQPARPPVQPGELKIPVELNHKARQALRAAKDAFHNRVLQYSEVFGLHETAELMNVSVRFMKNFGYDRDIKFAGEPRSYSVSMADEVDLDDEDDARVDEEILYLSTDDHACEEVGDDVDDEFEEFALDEDLTADLAADHYARRKSSGGTSYAHF